MNANAIALGRWVAARIASRIEFILVREEERERERYTEGTESQYNGDNNK